MNWLVVCSSDTVVGCQVASNNCRNLTFEKIDGFRNVRTQNTRTSHVCIPRVDVLLVVYPQHTSDCTYYVPFKINGRGNPWNRDA